MKKLQLTSSRASDPKRVPCGRLTKAFNTALGCLFGPSLLFDMMRGLIG